MTIIPISRVFQVDTQEIGGNYDMIIGRNIMKGGINLLDNDHYIVRDSVQVSLKLNR